MNVRTILLLIIMTACSTKQSNEPNAKPDESVAPGIEQELATNKDELENEKTIEQKQKYTSVADLFDNLPGQDYSWQDGTLKLIDRDPKKPKIEIRTNVVDGHSTDIVNQYNRKGIVLVSMLCFSYMDIDQITITGIPQKITFTTPGNVNTMKTETLNKYKTTTTITRNNAIKAIKDILEADDFDDLFSHSYGLKGIPTTSFKSVMYDKDFYDRLTIK